MPADLLKIVYVNIYINVSFFYKLYLLMKRFSEKSVHLDFGDFGPSVVISALILTPPLMLRPALPDALTLVIEYLFMTLVINLGMLITSVSLVKLE